MSASATHWSERPRAMAHSLVPTMPAHHRGPLLAALAALALVAIVPGCGAKTGLYVPDSGVDAANVSDAGPDSSVDAGPIPCVIIEPDPDGGLIELPLDTEVQLGRADVAFLIDTTASMTQEIEQIRRDLRDRIVPGIRAAIPDAQLAVATFADFPAPVCGYGELDDNPFRLVLPSTEDIPRVQSALNSLMLGNGRDEPESQVEALYQLATGEGLGRYVPASFGCAAGGFGYPCFRTDALPVVIMVTDAPFHNGPRGAEPYDCRADLDVEPHSYNDAVTALDAGGIRAIGLYSGPGGGQGFGHLQQLAVDTDATDSGSPLVFDIGTRGERLTDSVIRAIETLASVIVMDIDTFLVDPDPLDGFDPRELVIAVVPVRAEPMDGIDSIDFDANTFRGVRTGTRVVFQLQLRTDIPREWGPRRVRLEVVFRGDGRTRIGSRLVELVLPGDDELECP